VVLRAVLDDLCAGRAGRMAVRQAVTRLPRALRRRRTLPPEVEAARRLLDQPLGRAAAH
jgi:hypothetical protein